MEIEHSHAKNFYIILSKQMLLLHCRLLQKFFIFRGLFHKYFYN